jgi:hypothetical protein
MQIPRLLLLYSKASCLAWVTQHPPVHHPKNPVLGFHGWDETVPQWTVYLVSILFFSFCFFFSLAQFFFFFFGPPMTPSFFFGEAPTYSNPPTSSSCWPPPHPPPFELASIGKDSVLERAWLAQSFWSGRYTRASRVGNFRSAPTTRASMWW